MSLDKSSSSSGEPGFRAVPSVPIKSCWYTRTNRSPACQTAKTCEEGVAINCSQAKQDTNSSTRDKVRRALSRDALLPQLDENVVVGAARQVHRGVVGRHLAELEEVAQYCRTRASKRCVTSDLHKIKKSPARAPWRERHTRSEAPETTRVPDEGEALQ